MSEMVERCAQAIYESRVGPMGQDWEQESAVAKRNYREDVRAVLQAMRNADGEMLADMCDTLNNEVSWRGKDSEPAYPCHMHPVWQSAIDAALEDPRHG